MDWHLALFALVVSSAFFIQTTLGFGAGLTLMVLGSLLVPVHELVPCYVFISSFQSCYIVIRHRRTIQWRVLLRRVLPWMFLGLPLGLLLFRVADENAMKGVFGIIIAVLSSVELRKLWRAQKPDDAPSKPNRPLHAIVASIVLFCGGVLHGAYSTGGPAVVYVLSRELERKEDFRSTINALWVLLQVFLIANYIHGGELSLESVNLLVWMVPGLFVGIFVGERAFSRIQGDTFRKLVYALLLVGGILLSRSLLKFMS